MPDWKACEGQQLDGKHLLERYLGGDTESALYLTRSGAAAVRIRRVDPSQAAEVVSRWNRVKRFPHPHLIRIEDAATADLAGDSVAYLVMEHAEENLADVLRDRPLTPEEARAMLLPVATALDYLHRRGIAHGDVRPSQILAIGDTVKLSTESVAEGEPPADMRALGQMLLEALPPRANLPPPFDRIAAGCLDSDPSRRWTADQVVARLQPPEPAAPAPTSPRPPSLVRRLAAPAALAAISLGVVAGVMLRRTDTPPPAADEPRRLPPVAAPPAPAPPPPSPVKPPTRTDSRDRLVMEDGVVSRVAPAVPAPARKTITGTPSVIVRITVDPAGNVTDAAVERTFSPYFGKLTLDAARKWKFISEDRTTPRHWTLRFEFAPTNTNVVVRKAPGE